MSGTNDHRRQSACLIVSINNYMSVYLYTPVTQIHVSQELSAVPCFPGQRVEVIMGTGMKMVQLRNPPHLGEWSLPHHLRRMLGCGAHNKIRAIIMMNLL